MDEPYVSLAEVATAMGRTVEAIRKAVERHLDPEKIQRRPGRQRVWVRLSDVEQTYADKVRVR